MDINNNQQINTFIKGMDTDTSDAYVGEGQYRYAENVRVVTDRDHNSGELHIIEGTIELPLNPTIEGQLLGFTSIREYAVAIVKHGDTWSIYRIDNEGNTVLISGPFNEIIWPDGWDGKTKPLSLVTRWESDETIKLYIADGIHPLMSINIAEPGQTGTFEDVFQSTTKMLMPIEARLTDASGASIPGVVMQYGYIIYKKRGAASTLSVLSKAVVSGIDDVTGYAVDENSSKIIELNLPQEALGRYVRIYRIAYSRSGQLPRVDIIYDQQCMETKVNDIGQSVQNVSTAEFIAENKLSFVPSNIESKGDYLFAADVLYNQDAIDQQFKRFDARCFSNGSYYTQDGERIDVTASATDEQLLLVPQEGVGNKQFDTIDVDYAPQYWTMNADGYNGHGLCFDWKYVYSNNVLWDKGQYMHSKAAPRTYARNEVYRFGVRLYDEQGRASSVKWIADIKMPDYFNPNGDASMKPYVEMQGSNRFVNNLSIKFVPRQSELWNGVYKYEIVQAKRSIFDSYKLMQGISGYPQIVHDEDANEICLPYYLTTQNFAVGRGLVGISFTANWYTFDGDWSYLSENPTKLYPQSKDQLVFVSPEYIYQPDDVKSLMQQYKTGIKHHTVALYEHLDKCVEIQIEDRTFNSADSLFSDDPFTTRTNNPLYILSSENVKNYDNNSDLRVGVYTGNNKYPSGTYYLTSQIMAYANYTKDNKTSEYEPKGGWQGDDDARKCAFFTNIIARDVKYLPQRNDISVNNTVFYEPASPDDFARDEKCKVRDKFTTLKNGKKFFNWTNPALLDESLYSIIATGNDDDVLNAWKQQTMTAYDDWFIGLKHQWITDSNGTDWTRNRGRVGAQALSFPTSPGGGGMILETGETTHEYFPETFAFDSATQASTFTMPPITVANIYKPATPYGGYNIAAINSTQYVGEGYVADKDTSMTVSMGDNHITMFACTLYHNFDNAQHDTVTTAAVQYIVPIESTMDLTNTCSDYIQITHSDTLPIPGDGAWLQEKPSTNAGRFTQTTDMYLYNTAYSVTPDVVTLAAEDVINAVGSRQDSRVHYSQKKQNNELIDNWTSFKAIDYLDVDSRYGEITGLKLFKDKLIFLQENGAGVLSVNDRIILKDQNSANIIVGNGGVLDRYDYFTTIYGMKPDQHVVEVSNDSLYWWDGYRKEIISYTDGYNINMLQRIKNVADYINNRDEASTPSILYDVDNKEVLFNVVGEDTLVYNEQIQQFTSAYTFSPIYYCNLNGKMLVTKQWNGEAKLYEYNKLSDEGVKLFNNDAKPLIKYVVNKDMMYNKVFDIQTFGGRFYKGDTTSLTLEYSTPLKQHSSTEQSEQHLITDREYDYRLAIPRNNNDAYGGRMRGKTMECQIKSNSNDIDFSIQYIITKYRMSWT